MNHLVPRTAAHLESQIEQFPVRLICAHHFAADDSRRIKPLIPHRFLHIGQAIVRYDVNRQTAFLKKFRRIRKSRCIHPEPPAKLMDFFEILLQVNLFFTYFQRTVHDLILSQK